MESLIGTVSIFFIFIFTTTGVINSRKEKIFTSKSVISVKLIIVVLIAVITANTVFIPLAFGTIKLDSNNDSNPIKAIFEQYFFIKILVIVVLAPLAEELFFRRLVYANTRKKYGPMVGYFLSIGLFCAIHFGSITVFHAFFLGSYYTFLYERTQSVIVPIIAHSFNNFLSVSMMFLAKTLPLFFIQFDSPWRYIEFVLAILLLLWSLRQIYQITSRRKTSPGQLELSP